MRPELQKVLDLYTASLLAKGSSKKTARKYYNQILHIYEECSRSLSWKSITAREIEICLRKKRYKTSTLYTEFSQIKSFLKFCISEWYEVIDPRRLISPKRIDREAKYLTSKQITRILNVARGSDFFDYVILSFFLTTGVRLAEFCSITRSQIRNATPVGEVYQLSVMGKWSKLRSVFPPVATYRLCEEMLSKHTGGRLSPYSYSQIGNRIREISKKSWVKFSAHTLRHTYLSHLARQGADIYRIQKIAGHSSIQTTTRYLHASNKELAETAKLVNNLLQSRE